MLYFILFFKVSVILQLNFDIHQFCICAFQFLIQVIKNIVYGSV